MRRRAASALVLLLSFAALSGCLRGDEAGPAQPTQAATNETGPNAELPDGRGEAIAFEETNKTEAGVGGVEHKHDYWEGAEQKVVFDDDVFFQLFPLYPEGEGSSAKNVAYIKLPSPNLVFEGTTSLDFLVSDLELSDGVAHPMAPALTLLYRTAAENDFLEAGPITPGTPVTIPVASKETDMPHSNTSLWAFMVKTDKPELLAGFHAAVTVYKGAAVVDWPGHPDFYPDNKTQRVVFEGTVTVHRSGIEEGILYGTASSWIAPEKLISHGTGSLDVFVNVTSASASNGASPTGFFLEYHDATILDAEDNYNDRIDDETGGRAFTDPSYHFVVPVTDGGMDGPYQPSSRWGFRMVATFAETPVASLCPGCFPYDITYEMKIVAHKAVEKAE